MGQQRRLVATLVILCLAAGLLQTTQAEAGNPLWWVKERVRRGLGWSKRHIVGPVMKLPEKIAQKTGPLAPIVQPLLTQVLFKKLPNVFGTAANITRIENDLKAQQAKAAELQEAYLDLEAQLRQQAKAIRAQRGKLKQQLSGSTEEGRLHTFIEQVMALEKTAAAHEKLADQMRQAAGKMTVERLGKMLAKTWFKKLIKDAGRIALHEASKEFEKLFNPELISKFLESGGLDPATVIEVIVEGDVTRALGKRGMSGDPDFDALKGRVRDRLKELLRSRRNHLLKNWRTELDRLIAEELEKLRKQQEEARKKTEELQGGEGKEPAGHGFRATPGTIQGIAKYREWKDTEVFPELRYEAPGGTVQMTVGRQGEVQGSFDMEFKTSSGDKITLHCESFGGGVKDSLGEFEASGLFDWKKEIHDSVAVISSKDEGQKQDLAKVTGTIKDGPSAVGHISAGVKWGFDFEAK